MRLVFLSSYVSLRQFVIKLGSIREHTVERAPFAFRAKTTKTLSATSAEEIVVPVLNFLVKLWHDHTSCLNDLLCLTSGYRTIHFPIFSSWCVQQLMWLTSISTWDVWKKHDQTIIVDQRTEIRSDFLPVSGRIKGEIQEKLSGSAIV